MSDGVREIARGRGERGDGGGGGRLRLERWMSEGGSKGGRRKRRKTRRRWCDTEQEKR